MEDKSGFRKNYLKQNVHTASGYLQNEWKTERWSFLVGGRVDKHSLLDHAIVSPRANVRFNPTPDWVLRANYSAGFRAPQIFDEDLHVDNAGGDLIVIENAKNLHEERSNSFSVSADWYTRLGAGWQLNLTAEGFYTELHDAFNLTESNRDGMIVKTRTNSSGAKVMGASLEGRLSQPNVWTLQAGATFHSSRWNDAQQWNENDAYTTRRIYRTPNVYGYFVSTFTPMKHLDVSLTGNFTGSMLTGHEIPTDYAKDANGEDDLSKPTGLAEFEGRPSATVHRERVLSGEGQDNVTVLGPRTFKTPVFFECGLKVQYTLPIRHYYKAQLYAGVQNLFDAYQDDFDRGYLRDSAYIYGPMAPRSYFAGVRLSF